MDKPSLLPDCHFLTYTLTDLLLQSIKASIEALIDLDRRVDARRANPARDQYELQRAEAERDQEAAHLAGLCLSALARRQGWPE